MYFNILIGKIFRFDSINLFRLRKVRSVNLKKRIYYFNTLDQKNETKIGHKQKRQSTLTSQVLCQTVTNYIMPRAALNNKGNWMYVVNLPEVDRKYSQLVKSETCSYVLKFFCKSIFFLIMNKF